MGKLDKYKLHYDVHRSDSDANEVATEASIDFYPAEAEGPYMDDQYEVWHEFAGKSREDGIFQAKDIIETSALDIDIFSLSFDGETIWREEDGEDEEE